MKEEWTFQERCDNLTACVAYPINDPKPVYEWFIEHVGPMSAVGDCLEDHNSFWIGACYQHKTVETSSMYDPITDKHQFLSNSIAIKNEVIITCSNTVAIQFKLAWC